MDGDGQIHTLSLLERLRSECKDLWGTSSAHRVDDLLRELANPNLQDIPMRLPFRVELWDRNQQHLRWVIAATSSVATGRAAFDVAISTHPREHLTLRNGAQVIRQHMPKSMRSAEFVDIALVAFAIIFISAMLIAFVI